MLAHSTGGMGEPTSFLITSEERTMKNDELNGNYGVVLLCSKALQSQISQYTVYLGNWIRPLK